MSNGATLSGATQTFSWSGNGTSVADYGSMLARALVALSTLTVARWCCYRVRSRGLWDDGAVHYLWWKSGGVWDSVI